MEYRISVNAERDGPGVSAFSVVCDLHDSIHALRHLLGESDRELMVLSRELQRLYLTTHTIIITITIITITIIAGRPNNSIEKND